MFLLTYWFSAGVLRNYWTIYTDVLLYWLAVPQEPRRKKKKKKKKKKTHTQKKKKKKTKKKTRIFGLFVESGNILDFHFTSLRLVWFTEVYIIFLTSAQSIDCGYSLELCETVLISTHNLCSEQKYENNQDFIWKFSLWLEHFQHL